MDSLVLLYDEDDLNHFFAEAITEVLTQPQRRRISGEERFYVANLLGNSENNNVVTDADKKTPPTLRNISDAYIEKDLVPENPFAQEMLAAYILMLTGFNQRRMKRFDNLPRYTKYGRELLFQAASSHEIHCRREIVRLTAWKFKIWQEICLSLHDFLARQKHFPTLPYQPFQLRPF